MPAFHGSRPRFPVQADDDFDARGRARKIRCRSRLQQHCTKIRRAARRVSRPRTVISTPPTGTKPPPHEHAILIIAARTYVFDAYGRRAMTADSAELTPPARIRRHTRAYFGREEGFHMRAEAATLRARLDASSYAISFRPGTRIAGRARYFCT